MPRKKKARRISTTVAKAMGASALVDYAGAKIAKRRLKGKEAQKFVKDTTTAKQARASGAKLAANIASLAAGGAGLGVVRAASNARKIGRAVKVVGQKKIKVNNPFKATQTPRRTRPVKFKITRRK